MITVKLARQVIWEAFLEDPEFQETYIANVACFLMDNVDHELLNNKPERDRLAKGLVDMLFKEE